MSDKKLTLRIITPNKSEFNEPVDMVIMRCTTGDIGIMHGHEPRSVALDYGILRMFGGGSEPDAERQLAVYGGLAQIKDNVLTVLTSDTEWPHEIDASNAHETHQHLEQRLLDHTGDDEDSAEIIRRDQAQLRRARLQIELSEYSG